MSGLPLIGLRSTRRLWFKAQNVLLIDQNVPADLQCSHTVGLDEFRDGLTRNVPQPSGLRLGDPLSRREMLGSGMG